MVLNTEWAQVEVIDLINDGSGLAFGIIGGRSTGVVVKTILPGGVADRDGRLQSGDHILQIGEVNLRGLGSEQVASVLRQCGVHVRMVVARPIESANSDYQPIGSQAPIVPTKILGDPVELDRHLIENGYAEAFSYHPPQPHYENNPYIYTAHHSEVQLHGLSTMINVVRDPLTVPYFHQQPLNDYSNDSKEDSLPETETYTVVLKKDDLGLGITVAGYVCEKEEISGIFVKSISKGSAADLTNNIKINDRIVEVDGQSVIGYTNHQAVELLRNTGSIVTIKLERYLRGPKYEQLQQAIRANELRPPSPMSPTTVSSLPKVPLSSAQMDFLIIEPDGESRTSFEFDSAILMEAITPINEDKEIVIGTERRALQFVVSSYETIYAKWREKLEDNVEIVIAQLQKESDSGLGISLEGTVDVEDGKEVRPHHYIRNILPDGPVGKNGILQPGDELLEVNGVQLLGLNHLEVVSILKQLPNFVSLVCVRNPTPIRIIDTSQHREAFQARKILADSLQTLIPTTDNNHLVKAKSETSLASSAASEVTRSKSLELIAGLPMWSDEPTVIELIKGEHGLGFSILDYQDPLNPQESVIVVRSLVPGGVAQTDGRLIPGDRLLMVNGTDLEHATLDRAVQVLKGTPRGVVRITVAKPLGSNDGCVSHASQFVRELLRQWSDEVGYVFASDTEEDQTCLEDFQECIEEFQECLDVVHICLEDDRSFNHSPCSSQLEDMDQKASRTDFVENNYLYVKNVTDSDVDVSFKSTSDNIKNNLAKTCSFAQSDKPSDGYDTCLDESLSEDNKKIKFRAETDVNRCRVQTINTNYEYVNASGDLTPTNSRVNIMDQFLLEKHEKMQQTSTNTVIVAVSEPCLNKDEFSYRHHLCLDTKLDDGLKSYDNQSTELGGDEFFLIQYPHESPKEVPKSRSEPNVLDNMETAPQRPMRKCLKEYYNDYADCLEMYRLQCERIIEEGSNESNDVDDDIFSGIVVPFKSRSMSDVTGSSFVMVTYDPGPDLNRRKSAFVAGGQPDESEMTVIRPLDGDLKGCQVEEMLQKHWGSTHTVKVYREPNKSLGISIVGGKVDIQASDKSSDSLLGIFVKNVVQDSPAGKTGQFKTGDRILEVSGVNLRQASHEKAVRAIRNASNPVTFVIQSLLPWKFTDNVSNQQNNNEHYSCPSPCPSPVSVASPYQTQNDVNNERLVLQTVPEDGGKHLSPLVTHVTPIYAPESPGIGDGREERSPSVSDLVSDEENAERVKPPPAIESDEDEDEEDDEEDERELEGRTTTAKGQQIDRASAGAIKRSKEEIAADPEEENEFGYTKNKVKKKYASLGHTVMMVQMERSSQGLGLSLAGHKDRNCMAVFVCGLNPNGAAYKAGQIQIGDEILEVNGVVLHGRCHLNAAAIIKGLSGPVFNVIILRRKTAIDDIAVKPITQFPILLAEEASEEQFSATYPNVRTVAIKKGTHSLGIMIIEGKHAEVGQGIFISDIQEGSSAEKAGLEIGEMILAVNKDSLVGSNYENAASLLKRTEGLVTLVVSNPGKKDSTPNTQGPCNSGSDKNAALKSSSTLKPTVPPSRPSTPVPEPVADPLTCQIIPGRDTSIEIATDNKNLGIFFIGGKDTPISNGIVIVEVYPGGTVDKDNRLQPGDQILEVNGTSLKDVTHTTASQALRQTLPKMKMIIYRPATIEYTTIETDLIKKPGKGLGLSILARKSGKGVYVADVINGGTADLDGKIVKGDLLVSVNGQSVENSSGEEAGAILKTVSGKVALKLHRYKPTSR